VGYNLSGAALNPARWFGTAFWQRSVPTLEPLPVWRDHLPYWMGPIVGALLAAIVHAEWLRPDEEEKKGWATRDAGAGARTPDAAGGVRRPAPRPVRHPVPLPRPLPPRPHRPARLASLRESSDTLVPRSGDPADRPAHRPGAGAA